MLGIQSLLGTVPTLSQERIARALKGSVLDRYWLAPWKLLETPDAWQKDVMSSVITRSENNILLCSRQVGKTESISACGYLKACLGGFVLIITPSDDQSMEFLDRLLRHHKRLQLCKTVGDPTKHELRMESGGRILALPNNEKTVRVYSSVDMLIIDEASRVPDNLYGAVRPMLAVSKGQTVLLSTPFGKRGFFYNIWSGQASEGWNRTKVPWHQCSRLTEDFINQERRDHGDEWAEQEYECRFQETSGGLFNIEAFEGMVEAIDDLVY